MGAKNFSKKQDVTRMFTEGEVISDEELALHIMHRFNICRDTVETMPAFDEHIKPLFSKEKEK
jgi:hypothetical protein